MIVSPDKPDTKIARVVSKMGGDQPTLKDLMEMVLGMESRILQEIANQKADILQNMANQKAEFLQNLSNQKTEILTEISKIRHHVDTEIKDIRAKMEQSDTITSNLDIRVQQLTQSIDDIKEPDYGEVVFIKNLEEKEEESQLELMDSVRELFHAVDYQAPASATVERLTPKKQYAANKQQGQAAHVKVDLGRKNEVNTLMKKKTQLSKSTQFCKVFIERHRPYRERMLETNMRRVAKAVPSLQYRNGMLTVNDK